MKHRTHHPIAPTPIAAPQASVTQAPPIQTFSDSGVGGAIAIILVVAITLSLWASITRWEKRARRAFGWKPKSLFPPKATKVARDKIVWTETFRPLKPMVIEYADRHGVYSKRTIAVSRKGHNSAGVGYLGAYEHGKYKTFRSDRVLAVQ